MNKAINKSIASILLAITCAFMPISAAEAATEKLKDLSVKKQCMLTVIL